MTARKTAAVASLAALLGLLAAAPLSARPRGSDGVVKAAATATAPDADGKRVVTITLTIDPKFHIYANPIGNKDFVSNQTTVTFPKGTTARIDYPAGELKKDELLGDYKIYKGKATIKATVQGLKDAGPLQVTVRVQACSDKACLETSTIKLSVP